MELFTITGPDIPSDICDMDATLPAKTHLDKPITLSGTSILRLEDSCEVHATVCCRGKITISLGSYAFIHSLHVAEGSTCAIHFEGEKSPVIRTLSGTGNVTAYMSDVAHYSFTNCVQYQQCGPVTCYRD